MAAESEGWDLPWSTAQPASAVLGINKMKFQEVK